MLRSFLIYLSTAAWARRMVTSWGFAWRAARRYVAGERLEDALQAVKVLNDKGINATLDHLGEHTSSPELACQAVQDVIRMLDAIDEAGVRSNVSIKLTQIGLALDYDLCAENLKRIIKVAKGHHNFIRIDMGDSHWVEQALAS